ncbi:hypothetical protein CHE218_05500 [Microbacterium sp. che218]
MKSVEAADEPPTAASLGLLEGRLVPQAIAERLLLWTVPDLEHRSRSGASHYETLGLAGILRRTIADKNSVVHAARQRLGLPLPTFSFTPFEPPPSFRPRPDGRGLVPALAFTEPSFSDPSTHGTMAEFLAAPAAVHFGSLVSVKRVIKYFAHVEGAVHLGGPEDSFERLVQQVVASVDILGAQWAGTLSSIAQVTVRGLIPMADAIRADPIVPPLRVTSIPPRADVARNDVVPRAAGDLSTA